MPNKPIDIDALIQKGIDAATQDIETYEILLEGALIKNDLDTIAIMSGRIMYMIGKRDCLNELSTKIKPH